MLAAGSRRTSSTLPGAEEHSFPLYSVDDATQLRTRMFRCSKRRTPNPSLIDQGALNFVIVGAGPTGVETAGAFADLVNKVMPHAFRDLASSAAASTSSTTGMSCWRAFSEKAHDYAATSSQHNGVHAPAGHRRRPRSPADRVVLSDGTEILTRIVVWAGGIQRGGAAGKTGLPQGRGGRLAAEPDLTVEGFPRRLRHRRHRQHPRRRRPGLPQLGPWPCRPGGGRRTTSSPTTPARPRKPFHYKDKGIMAMIGDNAAIAEVGAHHHELHGTMAFAAWLGRARLAPERHPPARRRLRRLGVGLLRHEPPRRSIIVDPHAPASTGATTTPRQRAIDVTEHYDVIIIGSGAGGGTLAHTLAPSGKRILLLERGDFLPREMDNWDPERGLRRGRYISQDTWYDADGKPFQPQVHYYVGGATKLYGAALYRLRPQDFGELQPRRRHLARVADHATTTSSRTTRRPSGSTGARQRRRGPDRGPPLASRTRGPRCRTSRASSSCPTTSPPAATTRSTRRAASCSTRPTCHEPCIRCTGATATRAWSTPRRTRRPSPCARCSTSPT